MSRSIRQPYYTQQQKGGTWWSKRLAAKAVRSMPESDSPDNGKAYRKYFNPWDIRDWSFHAPKEKKAYRK